MSQVINTNVASLNAQRNLNSSQGALETSLERLSSGLRINNAGDDAAGLAISERFSAQISGLEQAQRNSNDGISFAQTAEGGLDEVGNLLQRVRELSVQAANDTNSNSDRQALNEEVQQAVEEINRIASSTQFNDQNVLDGNLEDLIFQVGANAGQTIGVDGVDARGSELGAVISETSNLTDEVIGADVEANGQQTFDFSGFDFAEISGGDGSFSLDVGDGTFTVSDTDVGDGIEDVEQFAAVLNSQNDGDVEVEFQGDNSTGELIATNTGETSQTIELTATDGASTDSSESLDVADSSSVGVTASNATVDGSEDVNGSVTINGERVDFSISQDDFADEDELATEIDSVLSDNGFENIDVSYDGTDTFEFTNNTGEELDGLGAALSNGDNTVASASDIQANGDRSVGEVFEAGESVSFTAEVNGTDIEIQDASNLNDVVSAINAESQNTGVSANLNASNDDIVFSSNAGEDFDVTLTAEGQDGRDDATQDISATADSNSVFVNDFDVTTRDSATETLTAVDFAIDQVNSLRGDLGATQNRFESTISNLSITTENLEASRSRIVDADFAKETADLTKSQILQQAGTSVLAQANQIPQNVVSLLQ